MEILDEILELEYIKNFDYNFYNLTTVCHVEIKIGKYTKHLICSRDVGERKPYCTLITEFFTLFYDGTTLDGTDSDGIVIDTIDPFITEEYFFQQSCIKKYISIEYDDIKLLTTVYKILDST